MKETQTAVGAPSVAALVAALRIFAARGRAIRDAREKQASAASILTIGPGIEEVETTISDPS